ncbi:MAG: hypothetical protein ACPHL6_06560, partial [Rubripirellula sp.]
DCETWVRSVASSKLNSEYCFYSIRDAQISHCSMTGMLSARLVNPGGIRVSFSVLRSRLAR